MESTPTLGSMELTPTLGGYTWVNFCWVSAAGVSESLTITVYSVPSYRPHLSRLWARLE